MGNDMRFVAQRDRQDGADAPDKDQLKSEQSQDATNSVLGSSSNEVALTPLSTQATPKSFNGMAYNLRNIIENMGNQSKGRGSNIGVGGGSRGVEVPSDGEEELHTWRGKRAMQLGEGMSAGEGQEFGVIEEPAVGSLWVRLEEFVLGRMSGIVIVCKGRMAWVKQLDEGVLESVLLHSVEGYAHFLFLMCDLPVLARPLMFDGVIRMSQDSSLASDVFEAAEVQGGETTTISSPISSAVDLGAELRKRDSKEGSSPTYRNNNTADAFTLTSPDMCQLRGVVRRRRPWPDFFKSFHQNNRKGHKKLKVSNPNSSDVYKFTVQHQSDTCCPPKKFIFDLVDGIPKKMDVKVEENNIDKNVKTSHNYHYSSQDDLSIHQDKQHHVKDKDKLLRCDCGMNEPHICECGDQHNGSPHLGPDNRFMKGCNARIPEREVCSCPISRFLLYSLIRSLLVGLVQLTSDYFFKPILTILFNGIIQPIFILLYNMATSFRDLCEPIAHAVGFFLREMAHPVRALRLVEINKNYCGPTVDRGTRCQC
uniref:Uncharacterized protein n=1 Tax=Timema cristinae TaxID=61476 RepID=A0A7R9D916_TIMCR|nr:unnamed protein product [Timema cristinae]